VLFLVSDLFIISFYVSLCVQDYPVLYVSQERLPVDDKALETAIAEKVPKTRPNATAADVRTTRTQL
jgi:hypothetical protein